MNAQTKPLKSKTNSYKETPEYGEIEYKVMEEDFMKMKDLNKMGKDGWIFCHVFASNDKNQYLFYRKKQ